MTTIPVADERSNPDRGAVTKTLWKRIAEGFDNFAARRSRQAVPAIMLRRSMHDYNRCRRLILKARSTAGDIPGPAGPL